MSEHLEGCAPCAGELASFTGAREALVSIRDPQAEGEASASGLWSSLAPRLDAVDAASTLRRPWYRRQAWGAAAAAALFLALTPFVAPWFDGSGGGSGAAPVTQVPGGAEHSAAADAESLTPVSEAELLNFLSENAGMLGPAQEELPAIITIPAGNTPGRRSF